jgi:hypothetical protein
MVRRILHGVVYGRGQGAGGKDLEETLAAGAFEICARVVENFADDGSLAGRSRFGRVAGNGGAEVSVPWCHQNEGNR